MRVYVDFDGTLFHLGKFPSVGKPIAGAAEAMRELAAQGHHITIFSTRANKTVNRPETRAKLMLSMAKALVAYDIPFDAIEDHKPAYDILIDDRCISFHPPNNKEETERAEWRLTLLRVNMFEPLDWSPADGETDHTYHKKSHDKKDRRRRHTKTTTVTDAKALGGRHRTRSGKSSIQ